MDSVRFAHSAGFHRWYSHAISSDGRSYTQTHVIRSNFIDLQRLYKHVMPKYNRCLALLNDTISEHIDSCHYISGETNETVSCQAWNYNRTDHNTTIVTDVITQDI